jgi:hypothetical protein
VPRAAAVRAAPIRMAAISAPVPRAAAGRERTGRQPTATVAKRQGRQGHGWMSRSIRGNAAPSVTQTLGRVLFEHRSPSRLRIKRARATSVGWSKGIHADVDVARELRLGVLCGSGCDRWGAWLVPGCLAAGTMREYRQFPGSSRTSEEAAYMPGLDGSLVN